MQWLWWVCHDETWVKSHKLSYITCVCRGRGDVCAYVPIVCLFVCSYVSMFTYVCVRVRVRVCVGPAHLSHMAITPLSVPPTWPSPLCWPLPHVTLTTQPVHTHVIQMPRAGFPLVWMMLKPLLLLDPISCFYLYCMCVCIICGCLCPVCFVNFAFSRMVVLLHAGGTADL